MELDAIYWWNVESYIFEKNAILLYWYKYCKLIRARWIILSWDEDENQTNHEDEKKIVTRI